MCYLHKNETCRVAMPAREELRNGLQAFLEKGDKQDQLHNT